MSRIGLDVVVNDKTAAALGNINKRIKGIDDQMDSINKRGSLLVKTLIGIASGVVVKSIINTTARFQDLRIALNSVTGSAEKGAEAFDYIKQFATTSIFTVDDLTETFIKLQASGITPTTKLLTMFQDVASVTADRMGTLQAITDLYSRTTAGGLGLFELQRLGDRGIPVFDILQEKLGLTRKEVTNFGKDVEGTQKILRALEEGFQQRFGGATAALTGNLSQAFSNLEDALDTAKSSLGEGFAPILREVTLDLTDFIVENDKLIKEIGEDLGSALRSTVDILKILIENWQVFSSAVGVFLGYKLAASINAATAAMVLFNQAVRANELIQLGKLGGRGAALVAQLFQLLDKQLIETNQTFETFVGTGEEFLGIFNTGTVRKVQMLKEEFQDMELDKFNRQLMDSRAGNETLRLLQINTKLLTDELNKGVTGIDNFRAAQDEMIEVGTSMGEILNHQYEYTNELNEALEDCYENLEEVNTELGRLAGANKKLTVEQQRTIDKTKTFGEVFREENARISESFMPVQDSVRLVMATVDTFKQGVGDAFADAILGARSFNDALTDVGRAIIRQLVSGLIQIGLEVFVFDVIRQKVGQVRKEQDKLNASLGVELGLRTALAFFGGGGGGSFFGGFFADGGPVGANKPIIVGEQGPELFVPNSSGNIVPNGQLTQTTEQSGDGDVYVNFNITTLDASGFDELLVSRRGTIVGIINEGLNRQGKRALI